MKRFVLILPAMLGILLTRTLSPLTSQTPKPLALTLPLECSQEDCPLLRGAPQTAGIRRGFVRLNPGETVGWHTTGKNEESLVILHGRGEARRQGQASLPFTAPEFVYIPPSTHYNVADTGDELLEYVYVVAPV